MSNKHKRAALRSKRISTLRSQRTAARSLCEMLEIRTLLSAAISGTVFNDVNGNAVQDSGELGFSGTTVSVVDASNTTVATATTSSSGGYSFTGLPTGETLYVSVSLPAYALEGDSNGAQSINLNDGDNDVLPLPVIRAFPAPSQLTATSAGSTQVNLSWTSNSS